jgi:hypothetical protein
MDLILEWHINDLSLGGQYQDANAVRGALEPLLQLRLKLPNFRERLYCSRSLCSRPATPTEDLQRAVLAVGERDYIRLVLSWLANSGPFWDDERYPNADDYFEFEGEDVTNQGLGEATRRRMLNVDAGVFSFKDGSPRFEHTPLTVDHGLQDEPLGEVEVPNCWLLSDLRSEFTKAPQSWGQVIERGESDFGQLVLSNDIVDILNRYPFEAAIADQVFVLLHVLQMIAEETKDDGGLTERGLEVIQKYFVGKLARFTDESDQNKHNFKRELTFKDPEALHASLFCSWHGKIRRQQFRIHFQWPRPIGQKKIKVVYIGPKITKA